MSKTSGEKMDPIVYIPLCFCLVSFAVIIYVN